MAGRHPHPIQQMLATSEGASAARRRVRRLLTGALLGGPHDPERLDHAILEQRRAERAARGALERWTRWHQRQAA